MLDSIPNIIIGVGLALTFFLLAIVLGNAGAALTGGNQSAIQDLLRNASSKFWISVAALLCSIAFSIFIKVFYKNIQSQLDELVFLLGKNKLSHFGAEQAIITQMKLMQSISTSSQNTASQTDWQQVKFFEAMVGSVDQAVAPLLKYNFEQTQHILTEVRDAIVGLNDNNSENILALGKQMKEINQNAMRKMVDDFRHSLTAASSTESQLFQKTMKDLSQELNQACQKLVVALPDAASTCTKTLENYTSEWSAQLHESAQKNAEHLAAVSYQIKQDLQNTQASSEHMAKTLAAFAEMSSVAQDTIQMTRDMAECTHGALLNTATELQPIFDHIHRSLDELSQITQPASKLMLGAFDDASDGIGDVTQQLQSIVGAVHELSKKLSSLDPLNESIAKLKEEQYDFLESHLVRMDEQTILLKKILKLSEAKNRVTTPIGLDKKPMEIQKQSIHKEDGGV